MKTYIGNGLLGTFVERTEEFQNETDAQKKIDMKKDAWNRLMAYLFLKGCRQLQVWVPNKKVCDRFLRWLRHLPQDPTEGGGYFDKSLL